MEFRVWVVVKNEEDARSFVGEVVQKYPVSPQGRENELPVYNAGEGFCLVAIRVQTDGETHSEYVDKIQEMYDQDENFEEGNEADSVVEDLKSVLKRLKIKWMALVVNAREGQSTHAHAADVAKGRFKVIEDH